MKKSGKCPKCSNTNIIKIKDVLHSNGAGNISNAKQIFTNKVCARFTFYICKQCGYVEHYLDDEEIKKIK